MEKKYPTLTESLEEISKDKEIQQILIDLKELSFIIMQNINEQPEIQSKQDGEKSNQVKLDDKINTLVIEYFTEKKKSVAAITTMKTSHLNEINDKCNYILAFDCIDGVANIEANIAIGTIFGIYKVRPGLKCKQSFKSSQNLVYSGYILYSNTLYMCIAGENVNVFAHDEDENDYVLFKKNHKMPEQGDTYCINECYANNWYPVVQEFIDEIKSEHQYDMRYTGTLVADFHRVLLYGGVYLYPTDKKQKTGKLKLVYECIPLSFIAKKAGGTGITNTLELQNILDLKVDDINARQGLIIGSQFEINFFKETAAKLDHEMEDSTKKI